MKYRVKNKHSKYYGEVIAIVEYCKKGKWTKLKKSVGSSAEPLTDEMLNKFIEENSPEEINLAIKNKRGEMHHVDFALEDLLE